MYIQWIVSTKKSLSISWTITTCLTWQNQTSPFFLLFIFTTSHFPRPAAVPNNFVNFTSPTSLLGGSHPIFRPSTTLLNFNRTFDCCLSTDQTLRRNVKFCRIFLNIEKKCFSCAAEVMVGAVCSLWV